MAENTKNCSHRWRIALGAVLILSVLTAGCGLQMQEEIFVPDPKQPLLPQLEALTGGERTASTEEQAFFSEILSDVLPPDQAEQELAPYLNEVNAAFFLGSRLGLCEPFTLDSFREEMEQENRNRAEMARKGEVYFGPDQFELRTYFNYRYSALVSGLNNWLIANRDEDLTSRGRDFYEQNRENFRQLIRVDYEVDAVPASVRREDFRLLERQDPELLDFLSWNSAGQHGILRDGRKVVITNEQYETIPFEENQEYVIQGWLLEEGIRELLKTIAVGNPVTLP